MNIKPYINSLIIIFLMIIFCSCETVVEIDLPEHKPQLVLNCFFHPDLTWEVNLSHSLASLDNGEIKPVENATVSIYEGTQLLTTLIADSLTKGIYFSSDKPVTGKEYTIKVSAANYSEISAKSGVVNEAGIDTITYSLDKVSNEGFQYAREVSILFQDEAEIRNFYHLVIHYYDTIRNETYPLSFNTADPSLPDQDYREEALFDDYYFDGEKKKLILFVDDYYWNKAGFMTFVLISSGKEYYDYNKTYFEHLNASYNPFAEPVQVYTNVDNGFGIFAGYNSDEYVLILD